MKISEHRSGGSTSPNRAVGALTDPVRYPAEASPSFRTKRAFVLLLLTLLVPGSAQTVAGDRKLGRFALKVTMSVWAVGIVALLLVLSNRTAFINIITNPFSSLLIILLLGALAIGWFLLFLNTLRIIRPVMLAPGMRPVVGVSLLFAMFISSGTLGYSAYLLNVSRNAIGNIFSSGPAIDPVDGRYNFLMLGSDAGEDRTGRRPDSLSVLSVDAKTGGTAIISVPRNLQNAQFAEGSPMRDIYPNGYDCGNDCLVNAIYTEVSNQYADLYPDADDPGAQATLEAVSGTLGLTVQAYILVDMDGFAQLIDAMGGIRIKAGGWVPVSGPDIDSANGIHGMPDGWIAAGDQHLNGFHALWYGRSREFVDDFARIQRQQCVQQAMLRQMDPATLLSKFEDIAGAGTKVVESNISSKQLGSFVDLAMKAKNHEARRLTIGPPDFEPHFSTVPDFPVIHERVRQLLAESSGTPAAAPAGSTGDDAFVSYAHSTGALSAQALPAPLTVPLTTRPADFTPVTHTPSGELITREMLNELKRQGNEQAIRELVATNGQCAAL